MSIKEAFAEKWSALKNKKAPAPASDVPEEPELSGEPETAAVKTAAAGGVAAVLGKIGNVFGLIGTWLYRLRKVFMAVPVLYGAVRLAMYNMENLPEQVGLNLQASGEYALMIERNLAVYGPLGVTAACLLLMFCSRKALHPWVISIFTLVLPLLIWVTNVYPK